jgi:ABC-2 type transport system permease protein
MYLLPYWLWSSTITSLYRVQALFFKELMQLKRDKMTFVMFIMIPSVQLMLFGYAINTNLRHIPLAVVDHS